MLAVIVDIRPMREVGHGKHVAEWDLMDPTGQSVRFSLWGSGGDELSRHVRREDVVWIGGERFQSAEARSILLCANLIRPNVLPAADCRLSEYQGHLQLTANYYLGEDTPKGWGLQVCWRGNVVTDEDHQHRFHEGFRDQGFPEVDEVLTVVDWYRQRWRR